MAKAGVPVAVLVAVLVALIAAEPATAYTAFWSPGRTVGCVVDTGYARCDPRGPAWMTPAKPAWCNLEYGQGAVVTRLGVSGLVCADDTALIARPRRVLPYGGLVRQGRVGCRSTRRGMLCTNYVTRTGFLATRNGYRLYRGGR